jgi:hypothetical protein
MKNRGLSAICGALAMAAALLCTGPAANASTVTYNFSGNFPPSFTATVALDVVGGQAVNGTGTITFGADTFDLSLITLTTDNGNGNYGGTTGFRDNHGTDIFGGDTTIPIDSNGLIFAISNNPVREQDALFAAWADASGGFTFLISGTLASVFDVYYEETQGAGTILGSGNLSSTPLPPAWTMLIGGLVGLGFIAYRQKKNAQSLIAA